MQQLAFLQGLQMPELVLIFIVVLVIFGPKSLPKLGRALGQGLREFREATNKVAENISSIDDEEEAPASVRRERSRQRLAETSPESVPMAKEAAEPVTQGNDA